MNQFAVLRQISYRRPRRYRVRLIIPADLVNEEYLSHLAQLPEVEEVGYLRKKLVCITTGVIPDNGDAERFMHARTEELIRRNPEVHIRFYGTFGGQGTRSADFKTLHPEFAHKVWDQDAPVPLRAETPLPWWHKLLNKLANTVR